MRLSEAESSAGCANGGLYEPFSEADPNQGRAPGSWAALIVAISYGVPVAEAGRRDPIVPVGGHWCGMTDDGGPVHMSIKTDGKWVESISLSGTSSTENGSGLKTAQIAESKFIFRSRSTSGGPSRGSGPIRGPICRAAPCNKGGGGSGVVQESMIRGTFTSATSMRGNYSLVEGRRRNLGSYVAWPAEFAPARSVGFAFRTLRYRHKIPSLSRLAVNAVRETPRH